MKQARSAVRAATMIGMLSFPGMHAIDRHMIHVGSGASLWAARSQEFHAVMRHHELLIETRRVQPEAFHFGELFHRNSYAGLSIRNAIKQITRSDSCV